MSDEVGPTAVTATGLRKSFGPFLAVDDVSFSIERRTCFGLLGPNGAGKTTTMRMLSCLADRTAGTLSVLGLDPSRDGRRLKRRLGVVAQEVNLDVELTVRENLLVYARYFDIPRRQAAAIADELLEFVQLRDRADESVDRLSGGMKRRVQIARALVNDPELVLLDEPTTGLDPQARHLVWDRLRELRRRGVTIVLSTHYMEEAERLCDRLVVMDHGRIVSDGAPAELIARDVGTHVIELRVPSTEVPTVVARLDADLVGHNVRGEILQLFTRDADRLYANARSLGIPLTLESARPATLEDVFLRLTGHALRDD